MIVRGKGGCWTGGSDMGSVKASILKLVKDTRLAAVAFPMIVYTSFQAQADELARFLYGHGLECASYHAGKSMQV